MMNLQDFLKHQYRQQEEVIGPRPDGRAEQRQMAMQFAHYIIREVYEYLDALSFKHYLPTDELPRQTRIIELVDILKFWGALAWLEGVTAPELIQTFLDKSDLVDERLRAKHMAERIAGFDIDGVLAQWSFMPEDAEEIKEEFYESGGTLALEPYADAAQTLLALKERGWGIVLVTARKISRHSRLEHETHQWLKSNGIPYDLVLFGYDKEEALAKSKVKLKFFVEDNPKHALDIAKSGVDVLLLRSREAVHERIHYIDEIKQVKDWAGIGTDIRAVR